MDIRDLPDFEERLRVARRRARWEIGDPSWADIILNAFINHEETDKQLDEEMSES
jgi:hypothetical protein